MRFRLWICVLAACATTPTPASADPVSIAAFVSAATWIGSSIAATVVFYTVQAAVILAYSAALSYASKLLYGKPPRPTVGVHGEFRVGGGVPRSFIVGEAMTAGSLVYTNTWDTPDIAPNAYWVTVWALSDLPITALTGLFVNDEECTYGSGSPGTMGYAIPEFYSSEYGTNFLWVKFYDGTQTTADSYLTGKFSSDANWPWGTDRVGKGVAYVIVTARLKPDDPAFNGFPKFKFVCQGIKQYDQRLDTTNGGSGSHRPDDDGTWAYTDNPIITAQTILRGLYYNDEWMYGLQNLPMARMPSDTWFAAANECDTLVYKADTVTQEKQYRIGVEVTVNAQPADVIEEFLKSCNAKMAEIGGVYKVRAGATGSAVVSITDANIVITEPQEYDPFPTLQAVVNGVNATYPEPEEGWSIKEAPPLYSSTFEAADGDRRLPVTVEYPAVPYGDQVQRTMQALLNESRKFRTHVIQLPPQFWQYEPLDVISWTSTRNGYTAKDFEIVTMTDLPNCNVIAAIKEVDPADYDFDPESDYRNNPTGNSGSPAPSAYPIVGFAAEGVEITGVGGRVRAGARLSWDSADVDAATGVEFEIIALNLADVGTDIGDMSAGGGLDAAFDADITQAASAAASKASATSAYIGKTFSAARAFRRGVIYGSNDAGYVSGANPSVTVNIRGKTGSSPSSATDGTIIGTITFADTADESTGRMIASTSSSTWDHIFAEVTHDGSAASMNVAELVLAENVLDDFTPAWSRAIYDTDKNIIKNTSYIARARYTLKGNLVGQWSDWETFTTPDVGDPTVNPESGSISGTLTDASPSQGSFGTYGTANITTSGGVVLINVEMTATDGSVSGQPSPDFGIRVQIDSSTVVLPLHIPSRIDAGSSSIYTASWSHTPSAGAHTYTFEITRYGENEDGKGDPVGDSHTLGGTLTVIELDG